MTALLSGRRAPSSFPAPRARVLLIALLLAACSRGGGGAPTGGGGPPEVGAVRAEQRTLTLAAEYPAQLEALRTVEIRPQVSGIVTRVGYREGEPVARGALLFEIDRAPFEVAREQARAGVAQADANLAKAGNDVKRLEPLVAADAASQQELDNARAALQVARAGQLSAQAALRKAELDLQYTTLRAPEAGLAARSEVRAGALAVAAQTLMTTLYTADPMAASFALGERDFLAIQQRMQGGKAPTARLVMADGREHPHPATFDFFNAALDPRSGTMQARLRVPNPDGRLRAGQFARVVLADPQPVTAVLVPQRAVTETLGQRAVMVVGADGTVTPHPVRMGARSGDDWVVEQGVAAGELVMVDGFARLRPGIVVKPVEPARAADGKR